MAENLVATSSEEIAAIIKQVTGVEITIDNKQVGQILDEIAKLLAPRIKEKLFPYMSSLGKMPGEKPLEA